MKKLLFSLVIVVLTNAAYTQVEEISIFAGGSYYIGDLNYRHLDQNTNPALGIMYKRNDRNLRYVYRLQFLYGKIEAYDIQSNDVFKRYRNLNFSSTILELSALLEVNFFKYKPGVLHKQNKTPYLFFGIAGYNFKPKGLYNDSWYDLQALNTEGQNTSANTDKPYKLNQIAFPMGLGYKVNVTENFTFGIEYGARLLFTDYLDDVSKKYVDPTILANEAGVLSPILADPSYEQIGTDNVGNNRGDSRLKDWYFFTGVTLTWRFNKKEDCDTRFEKK